MRRIEIGLLGLGNVGSGVVRLLREHAEIVSARLGAEVVLRRVAVRDPAKRRDVELDATLVTSDARDVLRDRDIRIVVELIGGIEPARTLVLEAIAAGKHVVTANKALLAEHGDEIFAAAERAGVEVYFEAAVAGGIPIIRALREGLASDRVEAIWGIVNGTSNYILTRMADAGRPFDEVLREAQQAGYAEADPTLDVEGVDAAHKLAILATIAFGARLRPAQIFTRGVSVVEPADLAAAERFGMCIKHLAIAKDHGDSLEVRVHPALVPKRWILASVGGALNAVYVRSRALGPSLYYGHGAGGLATAVAVVSDVIEVCRNLIAFSSSAPPPRSYRRLRDLPIRDMGDLECRYYLRLAVADQPGVLARVAGALAAHGISIAEVVQGSAAAGPVSLIILTHRARERDVQAARAEIDAMEAALGRTKLLRIEE
ncbi:MAG: homoserine dehydrogenase [Myxococcota bacterium]